ncbi:SEFIR domain-containing protein [Lusitaniella coriacea]|uniref:phosphorylase family protein n=1 Tax=Lusitaniella coriacea TaxID=1983105 RepID=UPI003CEF2566
MTALPVEYMAVRTHLTDLQEEMHPQGTIYERGKFIANGQEWEVGIVEVGAGNAGTAVEAERAITYFQPNILLFVGIAGGIKDVAIGDVVAATKVYSYESGKVGEQFFTRPALGQSAYALVHRAKAEARKGEWLQRLSSKPSKQPRVFVAPIAAGEKVLASKQSDIFHFLRESYNDAVAVEMEGFGFLNAAFAYPEIKAVVIRGISDLIDGKNDDSVEPEDIRQKKASHHASAFAFEMLSKLQIEKVGQLSPQKLPLPLHLPKSSQAMVSYEESPKKVFISYSHDSQEHKDRVWELAERLYKDGIDVNIDQYEDSPPEGWSRWMLNQVEAADYALIVCTQTYNRRFRGQEEVGKGKGGTWEGSVIIQELYDAQGKNLKFIPITFTSQDSEFIPQPLRSATFYRLDRDDGYEKLYRRLTNQPANLRPELGSIQNLPPRSRKQFFFDENSQNHLKESLLNASKGLLNWKRTLGNCQQIPRPELEQLRKRITTEDASTTIVLGVPGCGKSSLMATLGHWAIAEKYTLLAIKADCLSNTVNTIEDLQRDVQVDRPLQGAIRAIANREKVIFLIDQLDAISELLDRQPGRLNVLFSLIQSLSDTQNVHIVATCREFEFHHGTQFARLDCFQKLDLQLPAWEKIFPILEKEKHNPRNMGQLLQELLRNPFHLRIFLEVAKPGEVFESFPKLLDRLWKKRILEQPEAKKAITFLTKLAERMTEEEVLWLPAAFADECPESCHALEQAGILMTNLDNLTLGFCHQTLYDHTLARSFARGSQSLSDFVLERQDGLFVRPILLRTLNYLRGAARQQYQKQLQILLVTAKQQVRLHIRTLLIEFVGAQSNPDSVETRLLIPLLNSETEGIKVLDATSGSLGWFSQLRDHSEFRQWLEKPAERAAYCSPFLTKAASFAAEDVWGLLEEYWLHEKTYDFLSIRAIRDISYWTPRKVWLTQRIIQRSAINWHTVAKIAERIANALPEYTAAVIRAHLDFQLAQAVEASQVLPPAPPPNADETELELHSYRHDPLNPLEALLQSQSEYYGIEKFAQAHPRSFLESIWSWFADLVQRLAYDAHPLTIRYCGDRVGGFYLSRSEIIRSLLAAIVELAKKDKQGFFKFFRENDASDLLVVHRLLARGLEVLASEESMEVLNYLLADSRRLSLGSQTSRDRHKETKKLITAIIPHLPSEAREKLEQAIRKFKYWRPRGDEDVEFRRRCLQYNREHRLSLLQAVPDEYLSPETKRLKQEEERALPGFQPRDSDEILEAESVGPRMTKDEMSHATDRDLLNLFNELSDETLWGSPRSKWLDDLSRAGGASQQSCEFSKLVKEDPSRFLRILPQLEPRRHESYVGAALKSLAETDFLADDLIHAIEELDRRGFVSEEFRGETAYTLEKIAKKQQGLPQSSILLLESWFTQHSQPELDQYRRQEEQLSHRQSPILFGMGGSHTLPHGRGNIVRAIAEGYLSQNPPDLESWAKFIRSQLGIEPHPAVWVDVLSRMPLLLNRDRAEATELFDAVIRNCPETLQYSWALYVILRQIGWFEPQETIQGWLKMLRTDETNFSQQAYGEMLFVQYLRYQDEWSVERIRTHLAEQENEALLCGLAYAASFLWRYRSRAIAAEILYTLASSSSPSVQNAVASVFRWNRDRFQLDSGMREIIQAVCENPDLLLKTANDLTEIIEAKNLVDKNPEVVAEFCQSLFSNGIELADPTKAAVFIAKSLTTIAIQLHRQPSFREVGLQIFEQLLALNLRETQLALEMLDRKPSRSS